ncbi:hypothetical protein ACFL2F_02130 [Myxococcota bacterium]
MRVLILTLLISSCGPAPIPHTQYHGELTDHDGQPHDCTLEITPTAPDRVHIHLDYGNGMCDGDGATIYSDLLLPDGGGEITFDGYSLNGTFFSALDREYQFKVSPERAKYVSPGQRPGSNTTPTPIQSPEGAK